MEESDDDLVARVARGDHDACRALVDRHLARIVAFAGRVLGDAAEASDVGQEVFLRVWTHAGSWRPGGARFTTWLFRVATNLCRDRLRRRTVPLGEEHEPADPSPPAVALLEEAEVRRQVARCVAGLPERQREALALCHYEGLRGAEAAAVMGVSVDALESLLARARRTLRAQLQPLAAAPARGCR